MPWKKKRKVTSNFKTPLQQWAWNRFQLKGTVTSAQAQLRQKIGMANVTPYERSKLAAAITKLDAIMDSWEQNHEQSRSKVK